MRVLRLLSLVISRLIEGALLLLGLLVFFSDDLLYLALWDLLAIAYLAIRVARVRSRRAEDWRRGLLGPRAGLLFTLLTSLVGFTAGSEIVISAEAEGGDVAKFVAVPAVLFGWAILHFGYAERYATAYFAALPTESFRFPVTERPLFADFAYFAFTIGTSFAVSDVETTTSAIRSKVLAHSVLSFLYNTAILGIAVGVLTGK